MKKLVTISLFIFWAVVTALFAAALVLSRQQGGPVSQPSVDSDAPGPSDSASGTSAVVLSIKEVAKHNTAADCWAILFGKVYDLTSFFDSHPGGRATIERSCGKDGTTAYLIKKGEGSHSAYARRLLAKYLVGPLGETKAASQIQAAGQNLPRGEDEREFEDD